MKRDQDCRPRQALPVTIAGWPARQFSVLPPHGLARIALSASNPRRERNQCLRRQPIFADRLRGPSGAGVADAPARRIGIQVWQTHFWRKRLVNL
jgi:hypothetical protein